MLSSNSWKSFQQFSSINVYEVVNVMLKSRANSTAKTYVRVIRKFLGWSKSKHFNMQLSFPLSVVSLYLFEVQQSGASSSSVILAHAALKWLHCFVPTIVVKSCWENCVHHFTSHLIRLFKLLNKGGSF